MYLEEESKREKGLGKRKGDEMCTSLITYDIVLCTICQPFSACLTIRHRYATDVMSKKLSDNKCLCGYHYDDELWNKHIKNKDIYISLITSR